MFCQLKVRMYACMLYLGASSYISYLGVSWSHWIQPHFLFTDMCLYRYLHVSTVIRPLFVNRKNMYVSTVIRPLFVNRKNKFTIAYCLHCQFFNFINKTENAIFCGFQC